MPSASLIGRENEPDQDLYMVTPTWQQNGAQDSDGECLQPQPIIMPYRMRWVHQAVELH